MRARSHSLRQRTRWRLAACFWASALSLAAQAIPPDWLRVVPGPKEAAAIEQGAERYGWPAMAGALRAAALEVHAKGNLTTADAWANLARWAEAWGEPRAAFEKRWNEARGVLGEAAAGEAPAGSSEAGSGPLMAEAMSPALRSWVLANADFSAAYFGLEKAADARPAAFAILSRLHARDAGDFADYAELAIAIALVHDTAPAPEWPHWQVTQEALPRRLPDPVAVFEYFIALDRSGRGLHRVSGLDAAEARFLVDLAAPRAELDWAREKVRTPLGRLDETYSSVHYRMDRIRAGLYVWPGKTYALDEILGEGGICVDQAYFASQAGKARGVPTLLFGGAGRDGRHAWFGYLGVGKKWRMDAGRYEEQRFVTGVAIDPQTWSEITDHELAFLSEGFRRERAAREAAIHASFARWHLADGRAREAELAARAAVRLERRETGGWEVLLALRPEPGAAREALAREAASAVASYPDLQAGFLEEAIASLRARGQGEEAERLGRELARRFAKKRGDLSVAQIAQQLARSAETQSPEEQMRLYRALLRRFGRGEGAAWWDEVVRPFVARLAMGGRFDEARAALGLARETLGGTVGSQLSGEMREMDAALTAAARAAEAKK